MTDNSYCRIGIALSALLLCSPAYSGDCEYGEVLQEWSYEDSELIICTFGTVREEGAEATWTGSGFELRFRSGDEISTLDIWSEAEPEITFSYSPGMLHVISRIWNSKRESYVPFIGTTYNLEAGCIRSESALLASRTDYDNSEVDRLAAFVSESYSKPESYDEVLHALYSIRDMGFDDPDKAISQLESIGPLIGTSAALSEYLSSIIRELEQVRALGT